MEYIFSVSSFTVEELKAKWKNLRDTFQSNRRAYLKSQVSGSGAIAPPTWKWWDAFKFLVDGASGEPV